MHKLDQLLNLAPKNTYIDFTTVWDIHNIDLTKAVNNKNCNLWKVLLCNKKLLTKGITLVIGAKGRSQHSGSEVLIFKGDQREKLGFNSVYIKSEDLKILK